jgi:hypothetical protein
MKDEMVERMLEMPPEFRAHVRFTVDVVDARPGLSK